MAHFYRIFFLLLAFSAGCFAQDEQPTTIKVRKESNLVKAYFDNVELKLMAVDRFGNPKENKIVSYKLYIKGKNVSNFSGFDNELSGEMISELNKQKKAVKIFFTGIQVKDDDGHLMQLPDIIEVWFPDCKNCGNKAKKSR